MMCINIILFRLQLRTYMRLAPAKTPAITMSSYKKIVAFKSSFNSIEDVSSLNYWKKFKVKAIYFIRFQKYLDL